VDKALPSSSKESEAMTVEAILKRKGVRVSTIGKEATIAAASQRLNLDHIGALVVVEGSRVVGIISERDIIGGLAHHGAMALEKRVEELMTWPVITCTRNQAIKDIMSLMTRHRIRHLPVVEEDALLGIVSIGDVVKHRLEELEMETGVLHDLMIARS
jgi:CBS domain-containing protein